MRGVLTETSIQIIDADTSRPATLGNNHYGPERFTYLPESNSYRCPAGEQLNYVGFNVRNRAQCLDRQRQTLWSLLTKSTVHEWTI